MSAYIPEDRLWTEDEINYKLQRGGDKEVANNLRAFGNLTKTKKSEEIQLDPEVVAQVKALDEDDVLELLKQEHLSLDGELKEQKFRLAQHFSKKKDDGDS